MVIGAQTHYIPLDWRCLGWIIPFKRYRQLNRYNHVNEHQHCRSSEAPCSLSSSFLCWNVLDWQHWHGFFQHDSNWADGPVGVAQCPIAPGHSFLYEFSSTDQAGTFWYHSHHGALLLFNIRTTAHIQDISRNSVLRWPPGRNGCLWSPWSPPFRVRPVCSCYSIDDANFLLDMILTMVRETSGYRSQCWPFFLRGRVHAHYTGRLVNYLYIQERRMMMSIGITHLRRLLHSLQLLMRPWSMGKAVMLVAPLLLSRL